MPASSTTPAAPVLCAGVTVALATPVDRKGRPDPAGIGRLVERALAGGVVGISPLGSTGEGARLAAAQRLDVLTAVVAAASGRVPVIAGLPLTAIADAPNELERYAEAGAAAALVAPPSYYPADEATLIRTFTTLADVSAIPLVLYNIPVFTKVSLPAGVVAELAQHDQILGIKDSSRDLEYLASIAYNTADFSFDVVTGSDTLLLASLGVGALGAIAASANLVPDIGSGICSAATAGEVDKAASLQRHLFAIVTACRRGIAPAGWKASLELAGVCSANLVAPAGRLARAEQDAIRADLESLEPELLAR